MKLAFKRGSNIYHTVIRTELNSQWSHGGILINGQFYESTALKGAHHKSGVRDYRNTVTEKLKQNDLHSIIDPSNPAREK